MANDTEIENENLEVLAHYYELESKIASIASITESLNDETSMSRLCAELRIMQTAANGVRNFLSSRIPTMHFNQHKAARSTIAARVLAIPELLEQVLYDHSDLKDIIAMSQANKGTMVIVKASPKLQTKLCYRPTDEATSSKGRYTTPFQSPSSGIDLYPGFQVATHMSINMGNRRKSVQVEATFRCSPGSETLPTIGLNWQRMFICQPPIYKMTGHVICTHHGPTHRTGTVWSLTGLTIGHLLDRAEKLVGWDAASACLTCSWLISVQQQNNVEGEIRVVCRTSDGGEDV